MEPKKSEEPKKHTKIRIDVTPEANYVAPKFLPKGMPDHIDQVEFWRACHRLNIPPAEWPSFGGKELVVPGAPVTPDGRQPNPIVWVLC